MGILDLFWFTYFCSFKFNTVSSERFGLFSLEVTSMLERQGDGLDTGQEGFFKCLFRRSVCLLKNFGFLTALQVLFRCLFNISFFNLLWCIFSKGNQDRF